MKTIKFTVIFLATIFVLVVFSCKKDNELNPDTEILQDTSNYYLFSPIANNNVYLINSEGEEVHKWETDYTPGLSVYLLDDGTLLRAESIKSQYFNAGGSGGRVALYDSLSNELWSFEYSDSKNLLHHDVEMLPNGNILMIAWEKYSIDEAIKQGINQELFNEDEIWADHIIEINCKQ